MVSTKHVVNEPRQLVNDGLAGLARLNPNVRVDANYRVTTLALVPQDRVALVGGAAISASLPGRTYAVLSPVVGQTRQKMLIPVPACLCLHPCARAVAAFRVNLSALLACFPPDLWWWFWTRGALERQLWSLPDSR